MKKKTALAPLTGVLLLLVSFQAFAGWRGLPVIAQSPETGVQYGVLLLQSLDDEAVDGKLSSIQYIAINSTEKQQRLVVRPTLYYFDYRLKLTPIINYSSFPEKFYGLGNETIKEDEEDFSSDYLLLKFNAFYNFYSDFHIQLLASSDDREITEFESGEQIESLLGSGNQLEEYTLKSKGLGLVWDTRNIPRYPSKGFYAEINQEEFEGDIYDYTQNKVDLRAFFDLGEKRVLAAQALSIEQDGEQIPFINLNTIGGTDVVRGIFEGRYRAPDMQALQLEFRKSGYELLSLKTGWTAFAASGKVKGLKTEENDKLHNAVGIGGHFFFNPEDKTTIRLDIAYGDDETGLYLMIDQAF
jgi:hypothetical protein